MESLTKQEAELISSELKLDVDNPTTQALIKFAKLYNKLACVYDNEFSDSRFTPTEVSLDE